MLISIYVNSVCYLFRDVINGIIILLCGICAAERCIHANAFPSKWILPVGPVWRRRRAESVTSSLCLVSACVRIAHCVSMTSPCLQIWRKAFGLLTWNSIQRNKRRRASGWFSNMAETKPFSFSPTRIIKPHLYINFILPLFCLIMTPCWRFAAYMGIWVVIHLCPSTLLVMVVRITPACRWAWYYCVESYT